MSNPPTVGEGPEALGSSSLCEDTHRAADGLVVGLWHLDAAEQIIASLREDVIALDAYDEDELAALETMIAQAILSAAPDAVRPASQPGTSACASEPKDHAMISPAGEGEAVFADVEAQAEAWSDRVEVQDLVSALTQVFDSHTSPTLMSRFRQQVMAVIQQGFIEGVQSAALSATQQPVSEGVVVHATTAPLWADGIVTDGERVAFAQKAAADHGGSYWATDEGDGALGWEPTLFIALTSFPAPNPIGEEKGAES